MTTPSPAAEKPPRSLLFWMLWLVVAAFFWGASFPIVKTIAGAFPPMTLAALRGFGGALSIMLVFLVMREGILPRSWREALDWVILGALNGWIANILVNFALQTMPPGQASLIQAAGPLITATIAAMLFAEERLTPRRILGIIIGFCGVAILIGPRLFGSGATPLAAMAMIGVASAYALGNIFVRLLPVADPKRLALGQQIMSALFAGTFALFLHGGPSFAPALEHWKAITALGVVSTGLPMLIFMAVLRAIGPTRASLTGYLVPTWAVILSAITLGETIAPREIIGGIVVMAGVYVVTSARMR